jgi:K+-transporting ATPase ATPase A chain
VVQTFDGAAHAEVQTLEAGATQTVALGPAASQVAIKQLGTNGGGFFNVNSAHPLENPTPCQQLLRVPGDPPDPRGAVPHLRKDGEGQAPGLGLLAAMTVMFVLLACASASGRCRQPGSLVDLGGTSRRPSGRPGGNMEGKEVRFGIVTARRCGPPRRPPPRTARSTRCTTAFTPLGGLVPMWLMQLGEVVFGGVGSGLYGMLMFAIIAVFIAGLMVGRTPEYLGKKIEAFEMKMASLVVLLPPIVVLLGTAIASALRGGPRGDREPGPHGFSEVLYAFSSAATTTAARSPGSRRQHAVLQPRRSASRC